MGRGKLLFIFMMYICSGLAGSAQDMECILDFLGTDSVEELNPYDVERLEDLLRHPLRINQLSEDVLSESGLFTRYQLASLSDYRARHGDVLSFTELSAVDGFNRDFVSKLSPFISLETDMLPGQAYGGMVRNELALRTAFKIDREMTYGLKYRFRSGERIGGGLSVSRTSKAESYIPNAYSGYMSYRFRRFSGRLIAGDFNARFGQGLALWNGMGFSGLTSASTFMKRPSGISASSSFTGEYSLRGLAGSLRLGRVEITGMTAVGKEKDAWTLMPAVNLAYLMKNGQASLTHYADFSILPESTRIPDMKTAADIAFCIRGTDIFAESVFDWVSGTLAALAGAAASLGENLRMAAMLRFYPPEFLPDRSAAARSTSKSTNEHAASLAVDWNTDSRKHKGRISADLACFPVRKSSDPRRSVQLKAQAEWAASLGTSFGFKLKFSERIRTWGRPFRTDLRADMSYTAVRFSANVRLEALHCASMGLLSYTELGYKAGGFSAYFRQGIFMADNWDDRIYAYERDAPGSFNVPAYYGRGLWSAFTLGWRFAGWGRAYLRAGGTSYLFMKEKKPGRAELKFHLVFTL